MFLLLFLLWIAFHARLDWQIALSGLVLSGMIYWFLVRHMSYRPKTDLLILKKLFWGLLYVLAVVVEAIRSNIAVSRILFAREIAVRPQLVLFKTRLKTDLARVTLANSITLTPGTITVSLDGDRFCVHCLDEKMAEGIEDSVLVRLLQKMEEGSR